VAKDFVLVRMVRIMGMDLSLFEFDYDLTWMAFFLGPDETIYGRYGGRDDKGPDTRNSLAGLRYSMKAALEKHRREPRNRPAPLRQPVYVENLAGARHLRGCIHCHQVKEIRREERVNAGLWTREEIWTYPLPENVGLSLEIDRGNIVRAVTPGSIAGETGIKPGDMVRTINGFSIGSFADAQTALDKAPARGKIAISWERAGQPMEGTLALADGWRKTNIAWRPSLLDLLPSLTIAGPDLTPEEKKALGFGPKHLAFRQQKPVHSEARAMGIQEDDIIIGVDGRRLELTMSQFRYFIRESFLVGDRVVFNLIRNGKRMDLPVRLK
jgi:hypothetical protein